MVPVGTQLLARKIVISKLSLIRESFKLRLLLVVIIYIILYFIFFFYNIFKKTSLSPNS